MRESTPDEIMVEFKSAASSAHTFPSIDDCLWTRLVGEKLQCAFGALETLRVEAELY